MGDPTLLWSQAASFRMQLVACSREPTASGEKSVLQLIFHQGGALMRDPIPIDLGPQAVALRHRHAAIAVDRIESVAVAVFVEPAIMAGRRFGVNQTHL